MFKSLTTQAALYPWHHQTTITLKSNEDIATAEKLYIQSNAGIITAVDDKGKQSNIHNHPMKANVKTILNH